MASGNWAPESWAAWSRPEPFEVVGGAGGRRQDPDGNLFLAVVVVAVLLALSPALQWLPEAALAAVVITAMWGSANPAKLTRIWAIDRVDFALGLITGIVVLAWDLLPAMITGIVLSIIYLVYRTSFPSGSSWGGSRRPATTRPRSGSPAVTRERATRRPTRCPA